MCFLQNSGRVPIERQTIDSRSADETDLTRAWNAAKLTCENRGVPAPD
jgi:hypothetical protein